MKRAWKWVCDMLVWDDSVSPVEVSKEYRFLNNWD